MSDSLAEPLDRLFKLVRKQGFQSWGGVKFVFLCQPPRTTDDMRDLVFGSDLVDLPKAQTMFDHLLSTGCSWLHLACAGLLEEDLLVLVSQPDPRCSNLKPGRTPSVNVAGMQRRVVDASFNALAAVRVDL